MRRRLLSAGLALALTACGAAAPGASTPAPEAAREALAEALFVPRPEHDELRADRWGDHLALVADGQVYGSNGEDMPTMVGGALYGLLAAPRPPAASRCASLGIASGIDAATLAGLGCGRVDVFERRAALFANAQELSGWRDARLSFDDAQPPFHVLTEPPDGSARYDVIVQAVGTTVLDRPFRLFTVERFEALARLLAEDGVLVQHIQLYEIHEETYRRLLRTMAAAFPHLFVISPDTLSSDTLVVASRAPVRLDLSRLAGWRGEPSTARFTTAANVDSDYAPLARAVFSSREDVLRYVGEARPFTRAEPLAEARLPLRPAIAPPDEWDAELEAEWTAATEAFGAQFGESLADRVHDQGWSHGGACLRTLEECPALRRRGEAWPAPPIEWAFALMEAGRLDEASDALGYLAGRAVDVETATATLTLLRGPATHVPPFDPLRPFPGGADRELLDRIKAAWLARATDPEAALSNLEALAEESSISLPLALGLAQATLLAVPDEAPAHHAPLERMSETPEGLAWLEAHPEAWCYVGWIAITALEHEAATRAMRRCAERPASP